MKRLTFMMVIVSAVIISTLNSCTKDDPLPAGYSNGATSFPVTLNLTTTRWEKSADGVFVNKFINVIPAGNANSLVKIYVVMNGKETLINQPFPFMNGELWATSTQTDIGIVYRGDSQNVPYLNVKVVFE